MRVLMTTDTVGGVWHYSLELSRGLAAHGVEVVLAAMGGHPSPGQQAEARAVPGLSLQTSDFKLEWMNEPWEDVARAGEWLLEIAATFRPHLVHLNNYAHGPLAWRCPVLMVGHSCVYSWYEHVHGRPPPENDWSVYRHTTKAGLRAATAVTAPSGAMLASLEKYYGSFRAVGPIHNGCEDEELPAGEKLPLIFGAGRIWDEAKNLSALDAVAGEVPWRVCIAGDCAHPDGGVARLRQANQLGRLERSQVAEWLTRAAIYALPARYEPFGLSALEAARHRCALVLGDVPSLREVWGDAALYVRPDRHADLRDALLLLIEDQNLREEMARSANARAVRYTSSRMTRAYLSLYEKILGQRKLASRSPSPILAHSIGRPT